MTDPRAWPSGEHLQNDPAAGAEESYGRHAAPTPERVADIVAEETADWIREIPPAEPAPKLRITEPPPREAAAEAGEEPPISIADTVREQLGGIRGLVESSLPLLVFVIVNIATSLKPALWAAVGSAVLVAGYRLLRKEPIRHAVNGLMAVGVAAIIAARTGRAADFYIINILRNSAGALLFGVSVLIRRPLVGYAWRFIEQIPADWRERPRLLRAFSLASVVWTAMFAIRAAVQVPLWIQNNADALGVVSIVLGWPLFGAALAFSVWLGRRALAAEPEPTETGSPNPR